MERKAAHRNPLPKKNKLTAAQGQPDEFLALAHHALATHYFPRIAACLRELGDEDVWWRPNAASNSAGNLVLHLAGNIRQWITSGLGDAPDTRDRNWEFSEQGPIAGRILAATLQKEIRLACRVLAKLTPAELRAEYDIQKFRVTGMSAVQRVVEHFAYHTGQIIYATKLRLGTDMGFTRLPGGKKGKRRKLPAI